jgi:hypothetical protein
VAAAAHSEFRFCYATAQKSIEGIQELLNDFKHVSLTDESVRVGLVDHDHTGRPCFIGTGIVNPCFHCHCCQNFHFIISSVFIIVDVE